MSITWPSTSLSPGCSCDAVTDWGRRVRSLVGLERGFQMSACVTPAVDDACGRGTNINEDQNLQEVLWQLQKSESRQ
jgi:hypothetical protein